MKTNATQDASVEKTGNGWRLQIEAGDARTYRNAQLDDYSGLRRSQFPHRPSKTLHVSLSARVSTPFAAGTWGFGLWNDPFGLSFGFGGNPFRLPALPNAAWFFYASEQNYLSFTDNKPAQGFLAQTFRSPPFHPLLIPAGLALPFSRKTTRRLLSRVIAEDSSALSVDTTQWRRYSLAWNAKRVTWEVDEVRVFESPVSPRPPLGFIVWIDNQFAAFTPQGKISAGVLGSGEARLEARDIVIRER
ncbi:MAG: hypothetical protein LDL51_01345 [Chloroflexi bacterium]|nr:hypothetical protein [Chloroflexota bacterium]